MPVGRRAEFDRLTTLLAEDTPVAVAGEPGIGKTTLLRAAAAASGRRVFEGGALSTLDWLDHLALDRALGRPMVAGDAIAVAADVEAAVGAGVLLLDDLHWAGTATLDVAARLARRVGVVAGVRTGDAGTGRTLERLESAGFVVLELSGLGRTEAAEVVGELRPDLTAGVRERLLDRAGGNPLLLRELAASGEPTESLRLALAARLRRLDATGREAFGLIALAGRPLATEALGGTAVRSLLAADLVTVAAGSVAVRHALLGELAVDELDDDERRTLHLRIAQDANDDGEAARHFALAGDSPRAFAAAMRAVASADRPAERASHLAIAADHASGPEADNLRLRAARALEEALDRAGVLRALESISADNVEAQAAAHLLRARTAWAGGDAAGLVASLDAGLALVGGTGSDVAIRLAVERSRVPLFVDGDVPRGVRETAAALELARAHDVDVARAEYLHGTALTVADDERGEAHLRAAIEHARAAGDTSTEFLAANNLVAHHESGGDPIAGRAVCREFADRAHELGLGSWQNAFAVNLANLDFHAGEYERVLAAEELLAASLEPRYRDALLEVFCLSLVDVGRIDEALRRIDAASATMVNDHRGLLQLSRVRVEAALWGGRPELAAELSDEQFRTVPAGDPNLPFAYVTRGWALLDLGRDPGLPAPAQDKPMLRAIPVETKAISALYHGFDAEAAQLFAQAADLFAPYHRRGELRTRWAAGEALRRAGAVEAVPALEAVEADAIRLGMLPVLGRVHRSLRAAGVRRSAPRTRDAGDTLTGRQRQVLALVTEGLTNAQIAVRLGISRHTVATQLAAAAAKLGATSRGHAAALATAL